MYRVGWVWVVLGMLVCMSGPAHSQTPSTPCSSTSQCQSLYNLCWQCSGTCSPIDLQSPITNVSYPRTAVCNDRVWGWLDSSSTRTACTYLDQPPAPFAACSYVCARFANPPGGVNPPTCDFGCNSTSACIRGANYTGVNDRPDRVCRNDVTANPTSAGCGVSNAAPCNNWFAGVSGASCLRYSTTSRGLCRANTTAGWCDTTVAACSRAGASTETYETCGSAECLNTQTCVAGAAWASAGSVCLRDVNRASCGSATACSDYLAGWDSTSPNICLKYSEASVPAFCDSASTCRSGVGACISRANETYITCSSGCTRLCDRGQPISAYPVSQVCHTDYQQHGCGSGLVCDGSGQCAALPPITPPIAVPPPVEPPALPPVSSSVPASQPTSVNPPSSNGASPTTPAPATSSPSVVAPSQPSTSPSGRNSSPSSGASGLMMQFTVSVLALVSVAAVFV